MSLVKAEGLLNVEANEDVCKCEILGQEVQRQKLGPFQTIPICKRIRKGPSWIDERETPELP